MVRLVHSADPGVLSGFDEIVDVRTPAEFAEDHVPGAINLPVLSDAERAEVGTIYVQESRQRARRIGAAKVARNIAQHLEGPLADRPGGYAPLVYCWRGGQRSLAMATVLEQVGWRPAQLEGGYRTYRRRVTARLYDGEPVAGVVLLDGGTGTGKTEILGRLSALGVQTLDLEGLAEHRGSLLGRMSGQAQPSQKMFESRLLAQIEGLDSQRPVVVEAESSKIGDIVVPPVLWRAMASAPRIEIDAPLAERAGYLARLYAGFAEDGPALAQALWALPGRHGRARVAAWLDLARIGDLPHLAGELIELHYDPAYRRSRARRPGAAIATLTLESLNPDAQDAAAWRIDQLLEACQWPNPA